MTMFCIELLFVGSFIIIITRPTLISILQTIYVQCFAYSISIFNKSY